MIAALFVQKNGVYFGLRNVDPYDEARDARLYTGPWPVVCHPPCARWGNYWFGGPRPEQRRFTLGDDGGCFASALASVRTWGGVLEHPRLSRAWAAHGLIAPIRGWSVAGDGIGWTCEVEQGHFGHRCRKPTWLYAARVSLPSLPWGRSAASHRIDLGCKTTEQRRKLVRRGEVEQLSAKNRARTPLPFRDLLISIAESAARREAA